MPFQQRADYHFAKLKQTTVEDVNAAGMPLSQTDWEIYIPFMFPVGYDGANNNRLSSFRKDIENTQIPGRTIERIPVSYKGVTRDYPGKMQFDKTLPFTIIERDDCRSWDYIYESMNAAASPGGYGAYFSDLATTIYLFLYTASGAVSKVHVFHDAWFDSLAPSELGSQSGAVRHTGTIAYSFTEPLRMTAPEYQPLLIPVNEDVAANILRSEITLDRQGLLQEDHGLVGNRGTGSHVFSPGEVANFEIVKARALDKLYTQLERLRPVVEDTRDPRNIAAGMEASRIENAIAEVEKYNFNPDYTRSNENLVNRFVSSVVEGPPNRDTIFNDGLDVANRHSRRQLYDVPYTETQLPDDGYGDVFRPGTQLYGETILQFGDPNRRLQIERFQFYDQQYGIDREGSDPVFRPTIRSVVRDAVDF